MNWRAMTWLAVSRMTILPLAGVIFVAGCAKTPKPVPNTTATTVAMSPSPIPTFTASPTVFVAQRQVALGNQPPDAPIPDSELKAPCPYISAADAQQAQGSHIYVATVSKSQPARCRFYYYSSPFNAVLEIAPTVFADAASAHNALVLTAQATTQAASISSYPNFAPGVDLISFRTAMFAPDEGLDWACAFVKGNSLVLIRTQQKDTSQDARNVASAIIAKF